MADQDLKVDQSAEDEPTGSSGGATEPSGGTPNPPVDKDAPPKGPSDGSGAGGSSGEGPPPSGGTDADPLGDPKDGPPTFEDDGGVDGQTGAGGGGGGSSSGGLFGDIGDAVSDAYDDVEDSVNDAADDAGDAASGAYDKVEGGAASLYDDVEHEVAEEWRDATEGGGPMGMGKIGEHQGGFLWDPEGTVAAPFQAADRAYDAVEDDIAKAYEDSGAKDVSDAVEEPVGDAYDAWKTLDDAPGDAIDRADRALGGNQTAEDVYENVETSVDKAYDDTEEAVADAPGAVLDAGYGTGAAADDALNDLDVGNGGDGSTGVDDFGRGTGQSEPADPLEHIDDVPWNATQEAAEQAGEEDAQEATSQVEGLLDETEPLEIPEPEALELG